MVLELGTMVSALYNASEYILVAAKLAHAVLVGNVVTFAALVPASPLGHHFHGLKGSLRFNQAAAFVPVVYFYRKQHKCGLLQLAIELRWMGSTLVVVRACLALSHLLLAVVPSSGLHRYLKRILNH